ncbi:hypothetical protein KUTeg_007469 [Tegillarca granosa]|uniref:CUB domain-containing protein n=1 Tax=Tegillarca granosa TaxID=220873 RepID=A0ABQ9FDD7_TEGGR|nr:hypothetical protein KUTeg_007469 [Tegillarca granosa]
MKSPFLFVMVLVVCLPSLSLIQFCGGQYFDGNDLHLDTFEASTRKTICDCSFKIKNSTIITLSTKTNPVQTSTECDITSTRIEFKIAENTSINGIICDYAAKSLDIRSGQTLQITFYNELVNLEKYCLNLDTTAESQTFEGMCYSDGFTTTELSTHSSKENKVTVDEKEQEAYTSGTRKDQNKDSTTTSYTSTGYLSTSNAITTMNDLETSSIYGEWVIYESDVTICGKQSILS